MTSKLLASKRINGDNGGETREGGPLTRPQPSETFSDLHGARLDVHRLCTMSNSNLTFPRDLLTRFILLYKECPCLWNRYCVAYKHKEKRQEAISRLTELVHEYDPSATRVHVLRKIESLRACVRREYKKVRASLLEAESQQEIYEPNLWYYNLLSFAFMEPDEGRITKREVVPVTHIDLCKDEILEDDPDITDESYDNSTEACHDYSAAASLVETVNILPTEKHYDEDKKRHCTEVDDEYDAIGINVAAKLRGLPSNMRILAEKLINDVLFQAQTNSLTPSTALSTPDPIKLDTTI